MSIEDVSSALSVTYQSIGDNIDGQMVSRAAKGYRALRVEVLPVSAKFPVCRLLTEAGYKASLHNGSDITVSVPLTAADDAFIARLLQKE